MSKEALRPATLKQPKTVEVKTALPWTLLVLLVVFSAGTIFGWHSRSNQVVTYQEIRAEVMSQLKTAETSKK